MSLLLLLVVVFVRVDTGATTVGVWTMGRASRHSILPADELLSVLAADAVTAEAGLVVDCCVGGFLLPQALTFGVTSR